MMLVVFCAQDTEVKKKSRKKIPSWHREKEKKSRIDPTIIFWEFMSELK